MTSTPTTYVATFDRIGRNRDVPAGTFIATDANHLADQIYAYARPHLRSSDVEIYVNLEENAGRIVVGGLQPAGSFTLAVQP